MVKAWIRAVQVASPDSINLTVEYNLKYTPTSTNIVFSMTLTRAEYQYWKDLNPAGTVLQFVLSKIKDVYTRTNAVITATTGLEGQSFDW